MGEIPRQELDGKTDAIKSWGRCAVASLEAASDGTDTAANSSAHYTPHGHFTGSSVTTSPEPVVAMRVGTNCTPA
jgi:hypothetical protein